MTFHSSAEIEAIVRLVVQRLRSMTAPVKHEEQAEVQDIVSETFVVEGRLLTLESLQGNMEHASRIQVAPGTVVTPAVKDELRSRKIELVFAPQKAEGNKAILRSANGLILLADSGFSTQGIAIGEVTTSSGNVLADTGRLAAHLNSGGQGCLWWSGTPFLAMRTTESNRNLRAIQLLRIQDLERAKKEAEPNVLILDSQQWNSNQVANLASEWSKRLG